MLKTGGNYGTEMQQPGGSASLYFFNFSSGTNK